MRVLLDECIDWRLSRELTSHQVATVHQMGWTGFKNGELLTLAAQHFDVFVTVDRNLSFQQSLAATTIGVIVLRARTNRLADLTPLVRALMSAVAAAKPGVVAFVDADES